MIFKVFTGNPTLTLATDVFFIKQTSTLVSKPVDKAYLKNSCEGHLDVSYRADFSELLNIRT